VLRRHRKSSWLCRCNCGKQRIVEGCNLVTGKSASCGCWRNEVNRKRNSTHGASRSREYTSWNAMKMRCLNPRRTSYKDYGGRGIRISPRWISSFETFLADMGPRPPGTTLERIKTSGNYEPGNCCWATRLVQNNNTKQNVLLQFNGKLRTVAQWARELSIKAPTLRRRLAAGWTIAETLTIKPRDWGR
jgi:hypothetical protein